MKTAVLIPCYNEAKTIAKVVQDFRKALPDAEIFVFDNNSTDGTGDIAKANGAIVEREPRQGKGNVIRSMFREVDADCYIMADGDDTYPAESAPEMARLVLDGKCDMVVGDRLSSTYSEENKRRFHDFGNTLVRALVNVCFNGNVTDVMTGFRAFSPLFVKSFPVLSKGFEIETEMTIHALDKNFHLASVPVQYRDRPAGSASKLNTYSDGFKVLLTIGNLVKEYRPFLFFSGCALFLFLLATALFIPILTEFLRTGLVPKFPTLIMSGVIATIAIMCFFCGMILDMIARKSRQQFEFNLTMLSMRLKRR